MWETIPGFGRIYTYSATTAFCPPPARHNIVLNATASDCVRSDRMGVSLKRGKDGSSHDKRRCGRGPDWGI